MRALLILVGLWTLLAAVLDLIAIPSHFAAIGPLPHWQVYRVTERYLFVALVFALVGAFGLLRPWSFGRHATLVALTMHIGYSFALPLLDAEMDPSRAYPRLGFVALTAAAVLTSHRARATCGPRQAGALQPQGS